MKEWNDSTNSTETGETTSLEHKLSVTSAASLQEDSHEEHDSALSSNGNSETSIETEPETGSSKPSTPTKQVKVNLLLLRWKYVGH